MYIQMPLTYPTQEENLRSLIYGSNYELSSDINVQNNQFAVFYLSHFNACAHLSFLDSNISLFITYEFLIAVF